MFQIYTDYALRVGHVLISCYDRFTKNNSSKDTNGDRVNRVHYTNKLICIYNFKIQMYLCDDTLQRVGHLQTSF